MTPPIATAWQTNIDTTPLRGTTDRPVYAIGDIHGRYDLAVALLGALSADMATLPAGAQPLILFVGDYVDRGANSADVLSMLVWMRRHAPCDVVCLKGNHEAMLLDFLDDPVEAAGWIGHGGEQTLRAYGIAVDPAISVEQQAGNLRDALLDRMPAAHLALIRDLPVRATSGDFGFVHAGVRPGIAFAAQDDQDCLWMRGGFLDATEPFDCVVVHGHSWQSDAPVVTATRIGIDTGAYRTGVLTAAKLFASDVQFLQAMGAGQPAH